MRLVDALSLRGEITFTAINRAGRVTRRETIRNLVTDAWLDRLRDAYMSNVDITARYLAWGSSTTPPAASQTALVSEIDRKETTQKASAGTGVVVVTTYIAPGEGNSQLEEWGLFGGSESSLTMISRALFSHDKTASESLQVDWTFTIGRA